MTHSTSISPDQPPPAPLPQKADSDNQTAQGHRHVSAKAEASLAEQTNALAQTDEDRLRSLILGGEPNDLFSPPLTAERLSELLPQALALAAQRHPHLPQSALSTVETAIQTSVQTNSDVLSDALFPIIGPATRKSISSAISSLVQSLNQALEYSFSLQGIQWRIEAWRTGKSFAEVVLVRTLVYQVEQVFLIHQPSGLLIQQIEADRAIAQDPELMSAMLTAIQDFVRDSFIGDRTENLHTLDFGERQLWIESGPHAHLACVIRGMAPQTLRTTFQSSLEDIHRAFAPALARFQGRENELKGTLSYLEDCLKAQYKKDAPDVPEQPKPQKITQRQRRTIRTAMSGLAVVLGLWATVNYLNAQQWNRYLALLEQQPGIVVIEHHRQGRRYAISGLRDPAAAVPQTLLEQTTIDPARVSMSWQPYLSLTPELLNQRIHALLEPPSTVEILLSEELVLTLKGQATEEWIAQTNQRLPGIAGISSWDNSALVSFAEAQWQTQWSQLISAVEARQITFDRSALVLSESEQLKLNAQLRDIQQLTEMAAARDRSLEVTVIGHPTLAGTASQADEAAIERANYVRRWLLRLGANPTVVRAVTPESSSRHLSESNTPLPESPHVTFKIK